MFSELKVINHVQSVRCFSGKLYYCIDSKLYDEAHSLVAENIEAQTFWHSDGYLFYNAKVNPCAMILKASIQIDLSDKTIAPDSYFKNTVCVAIKSIFNPDIISFTKSWELFDIAKRNVVFDIGETTGGGIIHHDEDFILIEDRKLVIMLFSKKTRSISWHYDLSYLDSSDMQLRNVKDKFRKFLGVFDNKIFILSETGRIVVLNLHDGNLIKIIYSNEFPEMRDAFMHPETHDIHCLSSSYVKINAHTLKPEILKKITVDHTDPNADSELYGIISSSFQGKYIGFTSFSRQSVGMANWIGLFDYVLEKIIWNYRLLPNENTLFIPPGETPLAAGDKLYVLDSNNTLHVLSLQATK